MSTSYLPYEPRQQQLLLNALQDWLPEDHRAYFIDETVEQLDLRAFHAAMGRRPEEPAVSPGDDGQGAGVRIREAAYSIPGGFRRSCTRMWRFGCWLRATSRLPRTIREFRRLHLAEFTALFVYNALTAVDEGSHLIVAAEWRSGFETANGSGQPQVQVDPDPPNGWIKNVLGYRQFSVRGLHKCAAEFRIGVPGPQLAADAHTTGELNGLQGGVLTRQYLSRPSCPCAGNPSRTTHVPAATCLTYTFANSSGRPTPRPLEASPHLRRAGTPQCSTAEVSDRQIAEPHRHDRKSPGASSQVESSRGGGWGRQRFRAAPRDGSSAWVSVGHGTAVASNG